LAQQPDKPGQESRESAQAQESRRERRASHRVRDDQKSGQGSATALSKLKMIERQRAQLRTPRDDE
jgi:hypothetical protein